ncbi:MAG: site-specific integrase [bacterium]|nr:site-specific integrase [bacterium]
MTDLTLTYVTELRNKPTINSERTIESYTSALKKFMSENSRAYRMSKAELKTYLAGIRSTYSDSYYNILGSAMKVLYNDVYKQPNKMTWFRALKSRKKFVDIIKQSEFEQMMRNASNIKHKLIIILLYSTGVRLSELLDIKLSDIDTDNDRIFIRSVKGGKNRHVQLHELTKRYLLAYLKEWDPVNYLLNGQFSERYSPGSVQAIIKRASNGKHNPHKFRHTYLSNVIEKVDVFAAKELAGHSALSSTLFYSHIPLDRLQTMYNPLDAVAV